MRRIVFVSVLVAMLAALALPLVASAQTVSAEEFTYNVVKDSHKVKQKWDLSGTFISGPLRTWSPTAGAWDFVPVGSTWNYDIHIKEAVDGTVSTGVVHFSTTKADGTVIDAVGHVDATKSNYPYWYSGSAVAGQPNLAAVGTVVYNDVNYYFMSLYCNDAMWMALNDESYEDAWGTGGAWPTGRDYDVLSTIAGSNDFDIEPHLIRQ